MTNKLEQEAKTIGRKKTIKATAVVVAILLLILMFQETRGDFANGILFYIQAITNIHSVAILAILFSLTYLFGGKAGKGIILNNKNFIVISLTYSVLIYAFIYIYMAIVGITNSPDWIPNKPLALFKNYLLPLAQTSAKAIIPILAAWLWATYRMRFNHKQ